MIVNNYRGLGRITTSDDKMILRDTSNKNKVLYFTVAINSYFDGEQKTQFVDCVTYGKMAEKFLKSYKKISSRKPYVLFEGEWASYLKEMKDMDFKYKDVKIKVNEFSFIPTIKGMKDDKGDIEDFNFEEAINNALESMD